MTSAGSTSVPVSPRSRLRRSVRALSVLLLLGVIALAAIPIARSLQTAYHFRRAEQALAAEELDEAGVHLARCLELEPDSGRFHLRAAQAARRSGLYDFAAEHLEACERLGNSSEDLLHEWAMLRFQRGEIASYPEQLLLAALQRNHPDSVLILEALARGYRSVYALDHALRALDQWLERRPDSVQARLLRGWVYERLDRPEDAAKDYRAILAGRPDHAEAMLRLGQVLLQGGHAAEALPWFERLPQDAEHRHAAGLGRARCLIATDRADEARPILEGLAAEPPSDPAVLYEQGKLALTQARTEDAQRCLAQAATLAPHDYPTQYQFFLCLRRIGKEEEARRQEQIVNALTADLNKMQDLTQLLRRRPNDPDLRSQIAQIFLRRGEEREGVRWLNDVLRLHPDYAPAHRILADYYQGKGDAQHAAEHRRHLASGK